MIRFGSGTLPRCPRCAFPLDWCLCALVPVVPTRTRIELVRHVRERNKASNSGRVAALALPSLTLHEHGAQGGPPVDLAGLLGPGTALLFPPADDGSSRIAAPEDVQRLVVLDGTWAQARRMARRLPGVFALPRLVLPMAGSRPRLRTPHLAQGMATLEAIAAAVAVLEGEATAAPLRALFDELVLRGLTLRGQAATLLIRTDP